MLRFLSDESCDFAAVRALRSAGFDVKAVSECMRGADDEAVMELARSEARILLTEDKDFGQLVFAAARASCGVILLRFPFSERRSISPRLIELVRMHSDKLAGHFVVLQSRRTRFTRLP